MTAYDIRAPQSEAEWAAYYHLRWQILRQPWGQAPGSEKDQQEDLAIHRCAIVDAKLIAIGRLHFVTPSQAQIRYMATASDYRRRGIGAAILSALEAEAKKQGATHIILNARNQYLDFYLRMGYRIVGEGPTLFQSIQHSRMTKQLS